MSSRADDFFASWDRMQRLAVALGTASSTPVIWRSLKALNRVLHDQPMVPISSAALARAEHFLGAGGLYAAICLLSGDGLSHKTPTATEFEQATKFAMSFEAGHSVDNLLSRPEGRAELLSDDRYIRLLLDALLAPCEIAHAAAVQGLLLIAHDCPGKRKAVAQAGVMVKLLICITLKEAVPVDAGHEWELAHVLIHSEAVARHDIRLALSGQGAQLTFTALCLLHVRLPCSISTS